MLETLGNYPLAETSFRTFSEEITDEIITRWKKISENVDKEFLKDFNNYNIAVFQDHVFFFTNLVHSWRARSDELHLLKVEVSNKQEIELELTRERAEKLVGFKKESSKTKVV